MLKETIYISTIELQGLCNTEEHKDKAFEEFKRTRIYNPDRVYFIIVETGHNNTDFHFYRVIL